MLCADIRTTDWPLVSSPYFPLGIVTFYLYMALHGGPALMRSRKTPNISKVLVVYNASVLLLNAMMGIMVCNLCFIWSSFCKLSENGVQKVMILLHWILQLAWHIHAANYSFSCQRVRMRGKHDNAVS